MTHTPPNRQRDRARLSFRFKTQVIPLSILARKGAERGNLAA